MRVNDLWGRYQHGTESRAVFLDALTRKPALKEPKITSTIPITQPIRISFDARSARYRAGVLLAYPGLFVAMAGDAVRYSIGWTGWGIALTLVILASVWFLWVFESRPTLKRVPTLLYLFLSWLGLSVIWSQYQPQSLLTVSMQLGGTLFALFLANQFGWRQLLNVLSNTVRFILVASLAFELLATVVGPIEPLHPNYDGKPPSASYLWSQGNLFEGERIQGIVGNANLLAFVAVLGLWLFLVEVIVTANTKFIPLASIALSMAMIFLSNSAGMLVALGLITFAALVAIFAEGRTRSARRFVYARAIGVLVAVAVLGAIFYRQIFEILGRSSDASGRFYIWDQVWLLVTEKPVLGWGWTGYWIPGVEPWEGLAVINGVPMYQAHNAYLDVLVQLGVIGLALFLAMLLQGFIRNWRVAVRHTSPLYLYPLFILLVILGQSLTESRLIIEISWVLLVLVLVKSREGFAELEPMGRSTKLSKVLRSARRAIRKLRARTTH
jgi:O-antigen ligase